MVKQLLRKKGNSLPGGPFFNYQGPLRAAVEIILASASPRRQALLTSLGISFQVIPALFKEPAPETGQSPEDYALLLAREKALDVADKKPAALVIAADTIVVLEEIIMGKPCSDAHALEMLKKLRGNTHRVITGVHIKSPAQKKDMSFFCQTLVEMVPASDAILAEYVRSGEPADKAGAYAIQGLGGFLVKSVNGSYTNVVGLPLAEVWTALLEVKALRLPGEKPL